ncbi:DODA-type extradiol aromatic ring-opening family dioxygenase [Algibacillus agarilyticus]|uniref:DODA-type extradiol aromatic ring-opening family dioxygenase n=1 Tax=Algibacillus agarilyticus TaxID=2234133 RepID=UPI001E6041F4|nr:class III extradiol ring-cleavage dioxygenase [Algibacillus agarilyticus]
MKTNQHIMFISHGGGPMPLLGEPDYQEMVSTLKTLAHKVGKPSAILVISAHWEALLPTVTCKPQPDLIYDYGGFSKEAYQIKYQSLGELKLAKAVYNAMLHQGFKASKDQQRGFDHGVFVPLKIMYPDADIPCVQLSLMQNLDPEQHINMGQCLRDVAWDNLLIIGSGFSFHNLPAFFTPSGEATTKNQAFEHWLTETITASQMPEQNRKQQLINWQNAPYARYCHPREEHLLPLHVCYGAAGKPSDEHYQLKIMNKLCSMFLWQVK